MNLDNVTLTKPEANLVSSLVTKYGVIFPDSTEKTIRNNPCTGLPVSVTPNVASLLDVVFHAYRTYTLHGEMTYDGVKLPISIYDRVRYLIMKLDRQAYYDLVD